MPIITTVRPDQRRPNRYHIELDNGATLLLDETLVAEERLGPGDALSEDDLERLRAAAAERETFDRAARFLAPRPRSRAEVRRRLLRPAPHRAAPSAEVVERTLDRLQQLGYLDDTAFATYWAERRPAPMDLILDQYWRERESGLARRVDAIEDDHTSAAD